MVHRVCTLHTLCTYWMGWCTNMAENSIEINVVDTIRKLFNVQTHSMHGAWARAHRIYGFVCGTSQTRFLLPFKSIPSRLQAHSIAFVSFALQTVRACEYFLAFFRPPSECVFVCVCVCIVCACVHGHPKKIFICNVLQHKGKTTAVDRIQAKLCVLWSEQLFHCVRYMGISDSFSRAQMIALCTGWMNVVEAVASARWIAVCPNVRATSLLLVWWRTLDLLLISVSARGMPTK